MSRSLTFVSPLDERQNPPPEVPKLWGAVGTRDLGLLHAPEKMGKTMLGLNLALAGARGDASYLGFKIREGGFRTLIIQGEVHRRGMYERTLQMGLEKLTPEAAVRFTYNAERGVSIADPEIFAAFKRKLMEWKPDLVIIDPLAPVLSVDENSNSEVGKALKPLLALRDDPGCAILLIHHDGKASDTNSSRGVQQRARGANRLTADPDTLLALAPLSKKGGIIKARLYIEDRNGKSPEPIRIRLNGETLWFEEYSEDQEYGEQLVEWVKEAEIITEDELVAKAEDAWALKDTQGRHRTALRRIEKAVKAELFLKGISCTGEKPETIYMTKGETNA